MKQIPSTPRLFLLLIGLTTALTSAEAWDQRMERDNFTGTSSTIITAASKNTLRLQFPYQGRNRGRIQVAVDEHGAPTVYLSIEKGQIQCPIDYCAVAIKFGSKEPRNFVVKPSDLAGDFSYVRFSYPPAVLEELATSKDFVARIEVFGNGYQDLVFQNKIPLDISKMRLQY
jgi:hypothetical protein